MSYLLNVGLEVHVQANSKSKLFCACNNDAFNKVANSLICPICSAQPGALPQLNKEVVNKAVRLGLALKSKINQTSRFDRKSYFYPDNPKGYQITQHYLPILEGGFLELMIDDEKKRFEIEKIHIENDAGKLIHEDSQVLVDLNRAGAPLFEIVTKPCFQDIKEVSIFFKELQKLLRYLNVSDADMEKGMMRADVNISVRKSTADRLGQRVEIKNMNSFSEIEKAIAYEYERQIKVIEAGGKIDQVTCGWDMKERKTFIQRDKENAAEYRYFPEADLPPLIVSKEDIEREMKNIPELPQAAYQRFIDNYKLSSEESLLLTETPEMKIYFEEAVSQCQEPKAVSNWILSELLKILRDRKEKINESKFNAEHLAELICLIKDGIISGKIAKSILTELFETGMNPTVMVHEKGLKQNSNLEDIEKVCREVIEENLTLKEQYLAGKDKLFGAFVGKVMQKTKGQANPVIVNETLKKLLNR